MPSLKPKVDACSLVVVGLWNARLFSPAWVASKLFQDRPITAEVILGSATPMVRSRMDDLVLLASEERIQISYQNNIREETLTKAEALAIKIIGLLPHTPIAGIGINLEYDVIDDPEGIKSLVLPTDRLKLAGFKEAKVKKTDFIRTLSVDGRTLNLRHTSSETGYVVHFNFHYECKTSVEALAKLTGTEAVACKNLARELAASVYNLEMIEETANVHQ